MAHTRSVKLTTPIPSIEEYGKSLGLSRVRQRNIMRLINPDLTDVVVASKNGVALPKSLKTSRGKVLSTKDGKIVVKVVSSNVRGSEVGSMKLVAADRFKIAKVGDTVRVVGTKPESRFDTNGDFVVGWTLDEVLRVPAFRGNRRNKR